MDSVKVGASRHAVRRVLLASGGTVIGRLALFAQFGLITVLTRGLDRNVFAWTFTIANVALVASTIDRGVGAVVVGLSSSGEPVWKILQMTQVMRAKLRRSSFVVAVSLAAIEFVVFERSGTRSATLVALIALQTVAIVVGLELISYERIAYGRQQVARLTQATGIGVVAASGLGILATVSGVPLFQEIAPAAVLIMQPVLSKLVLFRLVRSESSTKDAVRSCGQVADRRLIADSRHFFIIQVAWTASMGIDQLLVSLLRSESEAAEFAAHARWFLLAQSLITVVSQNVWPVITSALVGGSVGVARRVYLWATILVVSASIIVAFPPLLGLVPASYFLEDAQYRTSLLVPMLLSFVVMQWGQLLGQVQAAMRDVRFQSQVIVVATLANVFASVGLCLVVGPEGAPWGTVVTYPAVLVIGCVRLARRSVWQQCAAVTGGSDSAATPRAA